MEYKNIRDQIKTGDLLVWKNDRLNFLSNLFLKIVRFFTSSEFAHVAIAWRVRDRLFVIEATIPSIRIYPVSKFDEFYHIPMNVSPTEEQLDYLLNKVGLAYSKIDAVRAYIGETLPDDDKWQCVELANKFYKHIGLDYGDNWTPTKFVNAILTAPDKFLHYVANKS